MNEVYVMQIENTVSKRYAAGANEKQESLCCPVDYDASLLEILPAEIVEKDYGCGDPSRYVREGDVVLDLGSGGGKVCYMAAQIVGEEGFVYGIDMTDEMLALARKYQTEMAAVLGNDRVEFKKGYIQDLALDVETLENYLLKNNVQNLESWKALEDWKIQQRKSSPMIADASVDIVISNCVLNLVAEEDRQKMIKEIYRVLKPGGRVAISDIISDKKVPQALKDDPILWSGCISGAFHEQGFLQAFLDAGFVATAYDKWDDEPWQVVEGIEFRSVTLTAIKPQSLCGNQDQGQSVLYKGPYAKVEDDQDQVFKRGVRTAIGHKSFPLFVEGTYADDFICFSPVEPIEAQPFTAKREQRVDGKFQVKSTGGGGTSSGCC